MKESYKQAHAALTHLLVQRTTGTAFTNKNSGKKIFVIHATQPTDVQGMLLFICDKHLYPELSYDLASAE